MTTQTNPFSAFTSFVPSFNPAEQMGSMLKQAQDGAHLAVKMTQTMMTEMDRQGADAIKWMHTAQEQAVAARTQAMHAWTEMVDRSVQMQRDAMAAFTAGQVK